jgi:hypothetical protein
VFSQHLSRRATPRVARPGAEPRPIPFDEARAVPRDEFVPLDGRRATGRRRGLNLDVPKFVTMNSFGAA